MRNPFSYVHQALDATSWWLCSCKQRLQQTASEILRCMALWFTQFGGSVVGGCVGGWAGACVGVQSGAHRAGLFVPYRCDMYVA